MEERMKRVIIVLIVLGILVPKVLEGQDSFKKKLYSEVSDYILSNEHRIINEFIELLSIPNVTSDRVNVRKNAEFIKTMMEKRGIKASILETKGNPVVYGELNVLNADRTLMFYVHYDGQPVDPTKWTETKPFKPTLRPGKLEAGSTTPKPIPFPPAGTKYNEDWRIYARGSSDDRAPIIGILYAIEAIKKANIPLKNNLKFIFEGEEEAGSTNLRPFLEEHKSQLASDVLFMCDGPGYYSGDPTLFFGVRGITSIEITVYGPNTSIHSGHYGNWAPNPAMRLAQLLATMKDADGKVRVKGFYDTVVPLTGSEIEALKKVPSFDSYIMELYGFSGTEGSGKSLIELIQLPSLNINGLQSGWVGKQARTIIPPSATASIDIRLTKGNDAKDMVQKVIDHIKSLGYRIVDQDPDQKTRREYPLIARVEHTEGGYLASRTSMDLPVSKQTIASLTGYFDKDPVLLPSLGGSLPIYVFTDTLNVPTIGISIANHDNNQHQPDENIRIGHIWNAIKTFAAVIMMGDSSQE
jgi:acetylornithine deacetylase/succinyl-diaminopimelate desuccinylase-like protein